MYATGVASLVEVILGWGSGRKLDKHPVRVLFERYKDLQRLVTYCTMCDV